jgi:hypothetical protein
MRYVLVLLLLVVACNRTTSEISKEITRHFESSGGKLINLAEAVPGSWEKVCILGPYSDDKAAKETLGFEWNAELKSSIQSNEGIALLLFVRGNEVVEFVEHSRRHGDFTNLTRKCFSREKAIFIHDPAPKKGWPGLFNKNEA